jgi:hypothetical protein
MICQLPYTITPVIVQRVDGFMELLTTTRTIERNLQKLQEERLRRVGPDKCVQWEVLE